IDAAVERRGRIVDVAGCREIAERAFDLAGDDILRRGGRLVVAKAARQQADKKAGAPVLDNPRLDAVLAAADAGCFATYIMKQGGVLVPR
ncbi:hypothetical protein, partial [Escherichia coli]|uniref:hypothetical protein n=1 Tax=Escherichia coli TaxID=562 RepID=UPI00390CB77E